MAIVTSTEMFKKAYAGKYAIGAFNEQHGNHSRHHRSGEGRKCSPNPSSISRRANTQTTHIL